jgi:hypothetical protein
LRVSVNYPDYAAKMQVKPVWQRSAANDTGYLTPPILYTPYSKWSEEVELVHGTVGSNTLPYFAAKVDANWHELEPAGSVRDGRLVCAHQLIPRDDFTIYDMVPAGFGCGHCNPGSWRGQRLLNLHARGYELENLQNGDGGQLFTEAQYIKLALSIAYHAAVAKISNLHICSHWDASFGSVRDLAGAGQVQATYERAREAHTDPNAGPFDWATFYGHLFDIRKPENWPGKVWGGIPLWDGRVAG